MKLGRTETEPGGVRGCCIVQGLVVQGPAYIHAKLQLKKAENTLFIQQHTLRAMMRATASCPFYVQPSSPSHLGAFCWPHATTSMSFLY